MPRKRTIWKESYLDDLISSLKVHESVVKSDDPNGPQGHQDELQEATRVKRYRGSRRLTDEERRSAKSRVQQSERVTLRGLYRQAKKQQAYRARFYESRGNELKSEASRWLISYESWREMWLSCESVYWLGKMVPAWTAKGLTRKEGSERVQLLRLDENKPWERSNMCVYYRGRRLDKQN